MDPYLESHLWSDVHHELASAIKAQLLPQIQPRYLARVAPYVVEDSNPWPDVGIWYPMYPDVGLSEQGSQAEEAVASYAGSSPFTPVTVSLKQAEPITVRVPVVEILDRQNRRVVTAIEVLSPVNKRAPGLAAYQSKRERLHQGGTHLLEIDLIRRGQRTLQHPALPHSHYLAILWRANQPQIDAWTFDLRDLLPVLPVPLDPDAADVKLNLRAALDEVYQRGAYEQDIDYQQAPPPPRLTPEEEAWIRKVVGG